MIPSFGIVHRLDRCWCIHLNVIMGLYCPLPCEMRRSTLVVKMGMWKFWILKLGRWCGPSLCKKFVASSALSCSSWPRCLERRRAFIIYVKLRSVHLLCKRQIAGKLFLCLRLSALRIVLLLEVVCYFWLYGHVWCPSWGYHSFIHYILFFRIPSIPDHHWGKWWLYQGRFDSTLFLHLWFKSLGLEHRSTKIRWTWRVSQSGLSERIHRKYQWFVWRTSDNECTSPA
jgi:hypothetical protein